MGRLLFKVLVSYDTGDVYINIYLWYLVNPRDRYYALKRLQDDDKRQPARVG